MAFWNGQVVLITGAAGGIGRAIMKELAARGAVLVAADIDLAAAEQAAREIGESVTPMQLDVRDLEAFRRVADDVASRFGPIDVMINNAGLGVAGDAHALVRAHWQRVLDVNLFGVVHSLEVVYPKMVARRSGRIVNIASLAGFGAVPFLLPYAASKAAVVSISRGLRLEAAAHGVAVNVVCPAAIETPLLDGGPPADLPPVPWQPNVRRYLTNMAGAPWPVERFAADAVAAIERDEPVIVLPARGKLAWRLGRLMPSLIDRITMQKARAERAAPPIAQRR